MGIRVILSTFFVVSVDTYFIINSSEASLHFSNNNNKRQIQPTIFQRVFQTLLNSMGILIIIKTFDLSLLMSNQPKGGTELFKKLADKGGSLFGGMKIKGPKETKNVAQTETNFSFAEKTNEESKSSQSVTRDDFSIKQQKKESPQQSSSEIKQEAKPDDLNLKKTSNKTSEIIVSDKDSQLVQAEIKRTEQKPKELKQSIKIEPIEVKILQSNDRPETFQERKTDKSSPGSIIERKKPEKVPPKKSDDLITRKSSVTIKEQKKRQQDEKPKKSDKDQVLDQINEYNVKLAQSVITQKTIQARICEIRESITELREKINHWSSQQSLCVEREEYEEADRLQSQIQEAQNKIDEYSIEMNFAEDQLLKQENQEVTILKNQNTNLKKIGRKLKLIELQLQDDAAVIKREEIEKIETLKNKQQIQRKKIQRIEKDITYQNQQIAQFQKIFKQQLDGKLNPLFKEKAKLEGEKSDLETQIKELERKLKEKKGQLNETNKALKSVTDNISQINESYREENSKLQERKNKLQIIENQHDEMKLQMENLEHTIEEQSKAMELKIQKKINQTVEMASMAKSYQQKQLHFDDQLETRRAAFDNFVQNGKILKDFQEAHRSEKDKIKEIQFKKNNITAEISKLEEKRDQIRKKIPIIEVEQKKFADQKNFKAAGLKKNQIKELNDELTSVKEKLEASIIEEHSLTIEQEKLINSQKENIQEEETLQKNLAISQYRYYSIKIEKITEYKQAISSSTTLNPKQKEKLLKQLTEILTKKKEELNYLNGTFQLSSQPKPTASQEEQDVVEADIRDIEIDEESNEYKPQADNNNNQQNAEPLVEEAEEVRIQQQEETGYVPLQLD